MWILLTRRGDALKDYFEELSDEDNVEVCKDVLSWGGLSEEDKELVEESIVWFEKQISKKEGER